MLWIIIAGGVLVGAIFGGWRSLRLARQGELLPAKRVLFRSELIAGLAGTLLTVPTYGWPFKEVSATVPEEITRTVADTVQIPVTVTKWLFFRKTTTETHEVTKEVRETRYHTETHSEFCIWLLIPMVGVGCLCFLAQNWIVRLLWRVFA